MVYKLRPSTVHPLHRSQEQDFSYCTIASVAVFIMMKIVLKVSILCAKCKICIMSTISQFEGVKSIDFDVEKNTATIVGDVDAVEVVKALRKAKKPAVIDSVGENKKPEDTKKPDDNKKPECKLPDCCHSCRPLAVWHEYEPAGACTIL